MSAAAPWSVKGIDPKAREIAKDLARRSGLTLGEWLNTMIMEDEDDGVEPLPRRPHASEIFERRGRSRRLDDAYSSSDETLQRVAASVEAIADRLEASERRSTVAIQGVDQAVSGLVRRLDGQDQQGKTYGRRIDDIAEELREGHRRLRRFEQETGPKTSETFGKVESAVGALASRLYDIEERQRGGINELRQRMDGVEKAAGPAVGADLLAQVGARLDGAQARTTEALQRLERSFAGLDQRLRAAEGRVEPEGSREAARFEKLAETLSRQVEGNRAEMMRRLDTAEAEGRMDRIERAVVALGDQAKTSEQRSAQAVEAMGREVLRIAQNLNGRMQTVEASGAEKLDRVTQTLSDKIDRDMGRYAQAVDQRLINADDRHALALEKLGGEITRISDRLSDRIAQSERKSAQALEDIARRLNENSSRIEQRYDRASGELAERMRLSEERTAQLLAEARDSIGRRDPEAETVAAASTPEPSSTGDWQAEAFSDEALSRGQDDWSRDPMGFDADPAFPGAVVEEPMFEPARPPAAIAERIEPAAAQTIAPTLAQPFGSRTPAVEPDAGFVAGGFGGADVADVLEATTPALNPLTAAPPAFGSPPAFEGEEPFSAETEFVDARAIRAGMGAGAAAGRAISTRSTIEAARAAMNTPEPELEAARSGFGLGLKRGGKSRLQERLDKQAQRDGSTVRKALLASVTAVVLTGGVYGYARLAQDGRLTLPTFGGSAEPVDETAPIAMSLTPTANTPTALTPADAVPVDAGEAGTLYTQATEQLDAGDATGVETLTRAANLGSPQAQLKLAGLYQTGEAGLTASDSESRTWVRRAAEGGDPRGMHAFGMYLFDGVGGPRNRPEALDWLRKAAERGLTDSQYNVARIYEQGDEGIARNPAEAYRWYLIAGRAGDQQAVAAANRLESGLSVSTRRAARAGADAFQVEALG